MKSRFKVLGHPAHPILIVFPLAFYPVAAIAEVIYLLLLLFGWKPTDMLLNFDVGFFWRAGFVLQFVGLLGTLAAALPGFVDWLNIPNDAPAKLEKVSAIPPDRFQLMLRWANVSTRLPQNGSRRASGVRSRTSRRCSDRRS